MTRSLALGLLLSCIVLLPTLSAQQPEAPKFDACPATPLGSALAGATWNGWGADAANTRFQPVAVGGLTAADVPNLALKWAVGFPNGQYVASQPTVVGGRIYVGLGAPGGVMALDAATACAYWTFRAQDLVRTAVTIGEVNMPDGPRHAAFFGDLQANVYAVDAETGIHLWSRRVDMHRSARIVGAPTLHEGRLYVPVSSLEEALAGRAQYECCTFRGSVTAFDAATGQEIWKSYVIDEKPVRTKKNSAGAQMWAPAGGAVWSSPTVDTKRGVLYVATGDAYTSPAAPTTDAVMALDIKTGRKVWVKQLLAKDAWVTGCDNPDPAKRMPNCPDELGTDFDFGQSAILKQLPNGRSVLAIGQKSGVGWALDPDKQGAILWKNDIGVGSIRGGIQFGSAADDQQVYFAVSDVVHGPERAGGLAAVNLATGTRSWYVRPPKMTCEKPDDQRCIQGQSAAVTAIPGAVFSGATNGIMRAYSAADGKVLWEYDTVREFQTVNKLPAKGGYIDGAGPTVVGGVVYFISGYSSLRGGAPGNVLLAFSPKK